MTPIDWAQLGVGVAAVLGLVFVTRTVRGIVRDTFEFMGNHMSSTTRAQENVARGLEKVADRLERVEDKVKDC